MIGYKLSLADIILYYGLHRYLVRENEKIYTMSYVCMFVNSGRNDISAESKFYPCEPMV
jgi:hypothetical protein